VLDVDLVANVRRLSFDVMNANDSDQHIIEQHAEPNRRAHIVLCENARTMLFIVDARFDVFARLAL
jgi:hypothetical protein